MCMCVLLSGGAATCKGDGAQFCICNDITPKELKVRKNALAPGRKLPPPDWNMPVEVTAAAHLPRNWATYT